MKFIAVLYDRKWSVKMKGKLFKACVRTAVICGSETWAMTRKVCCTSGEVNVWIEFEAL